MNCRLLSVTVTVIMKAHQIIKKNRLKRGGNLLSGSCEAFKWVHHLSGTVLQLTTADRAMPGLTGFPWHYSSQLPLGPYIAWVNQPATQLQDTQTGDYCIHESPWVAYQNSTPLTSDYLRWLG